MRRPPERHAGPSTRLALALIAAVSLGSPSAAQAQATKKAEGPDNRPLARYIFRDNLVLYVGSEGLDNHADAWKKTSAYKMLNDTSLGLMLEDVAGQLAEQGLGALPGRKVSGADLVAVVKHMSKAGFAIALNTPERSAERTSDVLTIVVRGANTKPVIGSFARLLGTFMGANKPKTTTKAGRYVVSSPLAGPTTGPGEYWAWWVENNNDLVVVLGKGNDDLILSVIDGKDAKAPNAVGHAGRVEIARAEGGFTPIGYALFDPTAVAKSADPSGSAAKITGTGLSRFDYRWGFQDNALMTVARLKAPRPRRGPLALFDQPAFDKTKLPPLPEGLLSFTVFSVQADKAYDGMLASASTPEERARLTGTADMMKTKMRVDLRKDLLARLGTKFAFYVMPGGASSGPPAEGGIGGAMGLMPSIPRFTLVGEVDDNAAFAKTLDNLMNGLNKAAREQSAAVAEATKGAQPKGRPATPPAAAQPEFKLTPSSNPSERSYVLNVPAAMAAGFPPGFRPTVRLLNKQLVISTTPDSARSALDVKPGQWTPPADLAPAFEPLPKDVVVLGARDNRPTLPENLATLPSTLQRLYSVVFAGPPPGGAPAAGRPPGLVLKVPVERLPKPEDLRPHIFPGSFAVTTDDQEVRFITRVPFPGVISPSQVSVLALGMPAFHAARQAAVAKAQGAAGGMGPGPGPASPGATKSARPGATTKPGRTSAVPKD